MDLLRFAQRKMDLIVDGVAECRQFKITIFGGHVTLRYFLDRRFMRLHIFDQIRNRA